MYISFMTQDSEGINILIHDGVRNNLLNVWRVLLRLPGLSMLSILVRITCIHIYMYILISD